jgi:hypothetical protein
LSTSSSESGMVGGRLAIGCRLYVRKSERSHRGDGFE